MNGKDLSIDIRVGSSDFSGVSYLYDRMVTKRNKHFTAIKPGIRAATRFSGCRD
jgi:hypothetical protein